MSVYLDDIERTIVTPSMMDAIRDFQAESWITASKSGFHKPRIRFGETFPRDASPLERLMLIDTETAEAAEEVRNGVDLRETRWVEKGFDKDGVALPPKPEGFGIELADVLIRVFDTAEDAGVDLAVCLRDKMRYNAGREYMHGRTI